MRKSYAVITGASSGIGLEFARQLAQEGYPLILVARRRDRLEKLAADFRRKGVPTLVITADLSRQAECYRVMEDLEDKKIGIFINNAGFGDCGCFLETDEEKEMMMVDVNIKAMHLLMKLILRKMDYQECGYLLNVASSAGLLPAGPYMAAYYATKSYVVSLTRAVARELAEIGSNVYVGALCPGPVDTEFNHVANVEFALPGISARECVSYAIRRMKRRKPLIVPTFPMQAATMFGRLIPPELCIRVTGHQQKKKI
jgi:hypothetical protein